LIAVLWLTAALAAVTFALAANVRSEIDRASTASEGVRAYYLASGSIDRAALWIRWGEQYRKPDGSPLFFNFPTPRIRFRYPTGFAVVEVIPENSKFNINTILPDDLVGLLIALGEPDVRAREIAAGILDWRGSSGRESPFDGFYAQQIPSFRAPHASFRQLEELLLIKGMTPDLYYGHFTRDANGKMMWRAGLRECATTLGSDIGFDINSVEPAVMETLGVPSPSIDQIIAMRNAGPIRSLDQVRDVIPARAASRMRIGGGNFLTLRATAWLSLKNDHSSETRRTVAALVKLESPGRLRPFTVLRWYDNTQSDLLPRELPAFEPTPGGNPLQ
jgi:general secretion pathway protein K